MKGSVEDYVELDKIADLSNQKVSVFALPNVIQFNVKKKYDYHTCYDK